MWSEKSVGQCHILGHFFCEEIEEPSLEWSKIDNYKKAASSIHSLTQ